MFKRMTMIAAVAAVSCAMVSMPAAAKVDPGGGDTSISKDYYNATNDARGPTNYVGADQAMTTTDSGAAERAAVMNISNDTYGVGAITLIKLNDRAAVDDMTAMLSGPMLGALGDRPAGGQALNTSLMFKVDRSSAGVARISALGSSG